MNTVLTRLDLLSNRLCGIWWDEASSRQLGTYDGSCIRALAGAAERSAVLTELGLMGNYIGAAGAAAIAPALKANAVLRNINLSNNNLEAEGGRTIADVLLANAVLIKCDLRYNDFGVT
eukprot:501360-Prymnesium_polylepis.1